VLVLLKLGDFWPKNDDFSNHTLIKRTSKMATQLRTYAKMRNKKVLWSIATVLVLGICLAAIGIEGMSEQCIEIAIANGNNASECTQANAREGTN
jgi:hypothetical protein